MQYTLSSITLSCLVFLFRLPFFFPLSLCSLFFIFSSMPEDSQCPSLLAGFLPSPLNKRAKTIHCYETVCRSTRQAVFLHSESSSSSAHWALASDICCRCIQAHRISLCYVQKCCPIKCEAFSATKKVMNIDGSLLKVFKTVGPRPLGVQSFTAGGLPIMYNFRLFLQKKKIMC